MRTFPNSTKLVWKRERGDPFTPSALRAELLIGEEIKMAIYHFSVKNISRADGKSVVAAAAYRSAEKLNDAKYGKEQDYTKKLGVEFKKIYAPENTKQELLERENLWNTVEKVETRKNSQLAREFEIAFPHELNKKQREQMLTDLCQRIVARHRVIVDACIHAPHVENGTDERNYHAHILLTTRSVNELGELGKKTREFNDNGKLEIEHWRAEFAETTNTHLENAGFDVRVDHRSYKKQGSELEATMHEGSEITLLRRRGIDTEISLKNDAIKERNAERLLMNELEHEIIASERIMSDLSNEKAKADAELAQQKKRELKAAQEAALKRKELDMQRFIDLQQQYADFAERYYSINASYNSDYERTDRLFEYSKEMEKKHNDPIYGNRSQSWYMSKYEYDDTHKKLLKKLKEDKEKLFDQIDIDQIVTELKQVAEKLLKQNEILPIPRPKKLSLWDKFLGREQEHIHSYDTLYNYTEHMLPDLKEVQESHERRRKINWALDQLGQQAALDEAKRKKEREEELQKQKYERNLRLEKELEYSAQQLRLQQQHSQQNERKRKNDNDFEI